VATELDATPLAAGIDQDTRRRVIAAGVQAMAPFEVDGGRVELPIGGHLVIGTTRSSAAAAARPAAGYRGGPGGGP
jgi:hypothetical protein